MKLTSILAICLGGAKALNPGDCAFTAVFADEPSQFGLLLLKDVEEEPVFVTDHGLMADGSLSRVGSVTKQHKGRVAAGTVLKSADFQGEGGSISGDHLVAYTGSAESPTLLCAVHMEDISAGSRMLSGLEEGISAVVLPESDNAYYTGPAFGTVDELRAAVNDRSLWTSENVRPEDGRILSSFVIQSGANTTTAMTETTTFMNSTMMTTTATTMFSTAEPTTTMPPTTMPPTTMPPTTMPPTTTTAVGEEPPSAAVHAMAGVPVLLALLSMA
ncbi:unnamed protein product [Effrenium voratum]|uniref:Uncharacterized protein n=1 Tax=Effrenium voratum TaxID=2562239 RepID=A0AA36MZW2_9DINO|nr:unnamed protein product [Effrenium voratum]CAJ1445814.1 unnamed protein product [Effrenium voratum]